MARRVNTQFLTILALIVVGIGTALFVATLTLIKEHPDTYIKRGDDALRDQMWTEAYAAYARAAQLNPKDPDIQVKIGRALHGRGQIDPQSFLTERLQYQKALNIDPNYLPALTALVDWYKLFLPVQPSAALYKEGVDYARRACELSPNDIKVAALPDQLVIQQWAAGLEADDGTETKAEQDLQKLKARDPTYADIPFTIARANIEKARRLQETAPDSNQLPRVTALYKQSIQEFEPLFGANNDGSQANNGLMHARFGELLEYLSGVDSGDPANHQMYLDRATAELDRARALIKPRDEGYLWVNQYRAIFAQRRKDNATAIQIYRSLPDSPSNRVDLADVLARDSKTRPEAERLLERTLAGLGDDPSHLAGARVTLQSKLTDMHVSDFAEAASGSDVKNRLADQVQSELDKLNSAVGSRNPLDLRRTEAHFQMIREQYANVAEKLARLSNEDPACLKDEQLQLMLASAYDHVKQTTKSVGVLQGLVDLYPRDIISRKELVKILLRDDAEKAKLQLNELARFDAGDPDVPLLSMQIAQKTGLGVQQMVQDYDTMPEKTEDDIRRKTQATIVLKKWDEAQRLLTKLTELARKDSVVWVNLVKVLVTENKKDDAIAAASKGLENLPGNAPLTTLLNGIKNNDANLATDLMRDYATANPDRAKGELALADMAAQTGDFKSQEEHLSAAKAAAPDSMEVLSALFDYYIATKRPDDAAALMPRLTAGNFDGADGELYRLHLAMARGDTVSAMDIAKRLTQNKADFAFSYVALGDVLQEQKLYEQAITQYGIAVQKQRGNILAYVGLAKCDYALNRPTDALRWINEGLGQQRDNAMLRQMLVVNRLNYGSPQEAIEGLKQEIKANPNDPGLVSALGDSYLRLAKQQRAAGNTAEASKTILTAMELMNAALSKWPDDAPLYMSLADCAINDYKVDLTEQILRTWAAREKWKNSPEPYIELARFYQDNAKPDQSETALQTAMANSKNDPKLEVAMADLFHTNKKFDQALQMLRTVNADNPTIRAKMIEILEDANRLDEAQTMIKAELVNHPSNSATLLTMWSSLLLNQQKYDEAAKRADESLALLPGDPTALYCRARARLRGVPGDPKGALEDMRAVSLAMPGNPQVCLDLAAAYLRVERPDDAATELETGLRLDPKNKQARMMLVQIYENETVPKLTNALGVLHDVEFMPPYDADPDIFQSEAMLLSQMNQIDQALEKSTHALRLNPNDPILIESNLDLLVRAGKYADVMKKIAALPDSSKNLWWALLCRGEAQKNLGHPQEGINDLTTALGMTRQMKDEVAFSKVMDAISRDYGNDAAIAAAQPFANDFLRARLVVTVLYHLKGDDQNAVAVIDPAVASLSSYTTDEQIHILTTAAPLYQTAAPAPLVDKAHDAYLKWLALDPHNTTALNNFAWLLDEQYNPPRLKEALGFIAKAVDEMNRIGRREPKLLDTQGWLLIQSGAVSDGVNVLQRVIDLKPFPEAYLHLGEGLLQLKYIKEAKSQAVKGLAAYDKMDTKDRDQVTQKKLQDLANRADDLLKPKSQAGVQ